MQGSVTDALVPLATDKIRSLQVAALNRQIKGMTSASSSFQWIEENMVKGREVEQETWYNIVSGGRRLSWLKHPAVSSF